MRYVLDSGILSDFVSSRQPVIKRVATALRSGHVVGICTPVLGEFIAGLMNSSAPTRNLQRLSHRIAHLRLWSFDRGAAEEFGKIQHDLRSRGQLIQVVDMQTAAIARALGHCVVITKDSDFQRIPGLDCEDWSR